MPIQMVARFRQISPKDGREIIYEHPGYIAAYGLPLPDDGSIVELTVPGLANPHLRAVRDESGLTIGWSCRAVDNDDSPAPEAPAPTQLMAAQLRPEMLGIALVSETPVAPMAPNVIRVDFKLRRRAA